MPVSVWSDSVVVPQPAIEQHPGFPTRVKDLAVQHLVSQLAIERLPSLRKSNAARHDAVRQSKFRPKKSKSVSITWVAKSDHAEKS